MRPHSDRSLRRQQLCERRHCQPLLRTRNAMLFPAVVFLHQNDLTFAVLFLISCWPCSLISTQLRSAQIFFTVTLATSESRSDVGVTSRAARACVLRSVPAHCLLTSRAASRLRRVIEIAHLPRSFLVGRTTARSPDCAYLLRAACSAKPRFSSVNKMSACLDDNFDFRAPPFRPLLFCQRSSATDAFRNCAVKKAQQLISEARGCR